MKNQLNKILKILVFIPNIPVLIPVAILTLYGIYKNSDIVDRYRLLHDPTYLGATRAEIKEYGEYIWPRSIRYTIAILFYLWLVTYLC
jgi:hypothetical protein